MNTHREKNKRNAVDAVELRRRAEELLRSQTTEMTERLTSMKEVESQRLIHELQVYQIELEMQNTELRQARDNLEAVVENLYEYAPVGYFTLDINGVICEANLTGSALLGIERSLLIGQSFAIFIGGAARSLFTPFLGRVFAGRNKETCEVALTVKVKQPLFVRIEALAASKEEKCRIVVIDISESKRAEEELRLRDRMIMQQSRQAALGEMIGNIAHHWRQPLNAVGLIIQEMALLSESGGLTTDHVKQSVDSSMRIIFSLSQTLNNFRNFYAPDKEKSKFNLNRVVAETVSFIEGSFKDERIEIKVESADDLLVEGFPNEFSQVLLNILFNARDALSERPNGSARIMLRTFAEKGKGVVTITDNGGGIKQDVMERIFEPYFTTKDNGKATGLGLFMAKTVIEKNMGGRLTARNVEGGAEFRIEV